MRITYLHQYFNTPEMSGGTRSYEMARRLVAMGHEVNMVTSWREEGDERDWYETEEAGIRVHWLPVPYSNHMSYSERMRAFVRFAWQAARKAASIPADVVFATSTPLTIALPGAYAARKQKVPLVFEVRDLWPDVPIALGALRGSASRYVAYKLESFAYRSSKSIVALTPTMRDFISGKRVPLEKISVIPNGADIHYAEDALSEVGDDGGSYLGKKQLLYCGGLGPAHGPEYLLDLARELNRQTLGVEVLVVGDGKLRRNLEGTAEREGILNVTIRFIGNVPREKVFQYYAMADASIMTMAPTEILYRHSVQNKFFDSLAAGRPVFSNYRGWASEIAEIEGAGEILPRDDVPLAARILHDRLTDADWISARGEAAYHLAKNRFSRDDLAVQLEHVLQDAVTAGGKGA